MRPKTVHILYWVVTGIFALAMFADGIGGITRAEAGQDVMRHLGYPMYMLTIFGVAKILGVATLIQLLSRSIKEWAYAGFAINFIGAVASRAFVGDEIGLLIPPIVMLGFMFISYFLWKRTEQVKMA